MTEETKEITDSSQDKNTHRKPRMSYRFFNQPFVVLRPFVKSRQATYETVIEEKEDFEYVKEYVYDNEGNDVIETDEDGNEYTKTQDVKKPIITKVEKQVRGKDEVVMFNIGEDLGRVAIGKKRRLYGNNLIGPKGDPWSENEIKRNKAKYKELSKSGIEEKDIVLEINKKPENILIDNRQVIDDSEENNEESTENTEFKDSSPKVNEQDTDSQKIQDSPEKEEKVAKKTKKRTNIPPKSTKEAINEAKSE